MGRAARRRRRQREPAPPSEGLSPAPAGPPEGSRGPGWLTAGLVAVLAAAALFRVAYFLQFRAESVFFEVPLLDAFIYDDWARRIAGGELRPDEPFYFAPGYPYALGAFYALVSGSKAAVYIAQFLLGLLNILLIHRLAWCAFGRRAALPAAVLAALYASFPFLETKLMAATLALTTLLAAMALLERAARAGPRWLWAAAGLMMGITSLIRPATLLAVPFLLAWIALSAAPLRPRGAGGLRWRPFAAAAALLLAGWGLALLPAAAHNATRQGAGILISSQGGITFYQSNNPRARGLYVALTGEGFSGAPASQAREEKAVAEKELGRALTRREVSGYWFGRGMDFILSQPGKAVWLLGMKLLRFTGSYEYSTEYILYVEREKVWLLWLPFVPFALLLALAVPSLYRILAPAARRRRAPPEEGPGPAAWLLLAVLAANLAVCLAFYVSSRYRLPSVPPLIVLAAATLAAAGAWWRRGQRARVGATAAVVLVIFLATHFEKDASAEIQEANVHYNTANTWYQQEEYRRALAEYRRAVEMDDSRYNFWFNMGNTLRNLERWEEAGEAYHRAGTLRKKFVAAHLREGRARLEAGQWEEARAAYLKAERLRPRNYLVHLGLGKAAAALGDRAEAIRRLDRALELRPGDPEVLRERRKL